jgi:hypothetical protein
MWLKDQKSTTHSPEFHDGPKRKQSLIMAAFKSCWWEGTYVQIA